MSPSGYTTAPVPAVDEAIERFKRELASGQSWFPALLETVKSWPVSEETVGEQTYRYIIAGEALDMLQIAERLLKAAGELVPEDEKVAFLFCNQPPLPLSSEKIRGLMGESRFGQYLNFFYGVTAEDALVQAVEDEVRKEEQGLRTHSEAQITDETYSRIYDSTQRALLARFRKDNGYATGTKMTLEQMKEFSYWRFKYRLKHCDKARIASDTKKALDWLRKNSTARAQ